MGRRLRIRHSGPRAGIQGSALLRLILALACAVLLAAACAGQDDAAGPAAPGSSAADPQAATRETEPQPAMPSGPFGFGRDATADEILAWDIDVNPSGEGLPEGSGSAAEGDQVYRAKCALCHGRNGEGVAGLSGALVMPYDPEAPWPPFPRTVGNYWPYATTLFDYVRRAMPANAPGSLSAERGVRGGGVDAAPQRDSGRGRRDGRPEPARGGDARASALRAIRRGPVGVCC